MTTREMVNDRGLVSRLGVELAKVGNWPAVTGPADLTVEMFKDMIDASNQPWWDGAPLHVGHFDDRPGFALSRDGDPALGWPENLRIEERKDKTGNPYTAFVGDIHRIPAGFAPALESAYRKRSIEWIEDQTGPDGRKYKAVLKGVGLLGATAPGVSGLADVVDLLAASVDNESKQIKSVFVGENGEELVKALSALSDIIHAQPEEIVHDIDQVHQSAIKNKDKIALGGQGMTDTLDARIREELGLSTDADIAEEIKKLKAKAEYVPPPLPPTETPKPEEPVVPTPETPTPEETSQASVTEEELAKLTASLQASPAMVARFAEMQKQIDELTAKNATDEVELTLKAAAKAGQISIDEVDNLRKVMLEGDAQKGAVLQVLAARPKGVFATSVVGSSEDNFPGSDDPHVAAKDAILARLVGGNA